MCSLAFIAMRNVHGLASRSSLESLLFVFVTGLCRPLTVGQAVWIDFFIIGRYLLVSIMSLSPLGTAYFKALLSQSALHSGFSESTYNGRVQDLLTLPKHVLLLIGDGLHRQASLYDDLDVPQF